MRSFPLIETKLNGETHYILQSTDSDIISLANILSLSSKLRFDEIENVDWDSVLSLLASVIDEDYLELLFHQDFSTALKLDICFKSPDSFKSKNLGFFKGLGIKVYHTCSVDKSNPIHQMLRDMSYSTLKDLSDGSDFGDQTLQDILKKEETVEGPKLLYNCMVDNQLALLYKRNRLIVIAKSKGDLIYLDGYSGEWKNLLKEKTPSTASTSTSFASAFSSTSDFSSTAASTPRFSPSTTTPTSTTSRSANVQRTPTKFSSGILLFYKRGKEGYLLLGKDNYTSKYSDFGGRSDDDDISTYHTAARELKEETISRVTINNIDSLKSKKVKEIQIKKTNDPQKIAYVLYLIRVSNDPFNFDDLNSSFKIHRDSRRLSIHSQELEKLTERNVNSIDPRSNALDDRLKRALFEFNGLSIIKEMLVDNETIFNNVTFNTSGIDERKKEKKEKNQERFPMDLKEFINLSLSKFFEKYPKVSLTKLLVDISNQLEIDGKSNKNLKQLNEHMLYDLIEKDASFKLIHTNDVLITISLVKLLQHFSDVQDLQKKSEEKIVELKKSKEKQARENSQKLPEPEKPKVKEIHPLDLDSNEAKHVMQLAKLQSKPHCIRKVQVSKRKKLFEEAQKQLQTTPIRAFHGTTTIPSGISIAKDGPDLSPSRLGSANGSALGKGFYTSNEPNVAIPYARGQGTLCVIHIITGKILQGGNSSLVPSSLRQQGYQCIQSNNVFVLSGNEQVLVDYLIEFSPSNEPIYSKEEEQKIEKLVKEYEKWKYLEALREAKVHDSKVTIERIEQFKKFLNDSSEKISDFKQQTEVEELNEETTFLKMVTSLFNLKKSLSNEMIEFFDLKAPIYSHKYEIINEVSKNNITIVQAATGSGKTVCIPLWMVDRLENKRKRVAVLVPRIDIAKEQANFVSKLRNWELGVEVGYAFSSESMVDLGVKSSSTYSKLVFMTYGYFLEKIQTKPTELDNWETIICDEAHERQTPGDSLIGKLCYMMSFKIETNSKREEIPRLIILSATMDPKPFLEYMNGKNLYPKFLDLKDSVSCPFPVVVSHRPPIKSTSLNFDNDSNDLNSVSINGSINNSINGSNDGINDGAKKSNYSTLIEDIKEEVLKIIEEYKNKSQVENILIFVSTRKDVRDLSNYLKEKLENEKIVELHGGLDSSQRTEALSSSSGVGNRSNIFVATNIAESGLTIRNISLVIDSGKRMYYSYDPELCITEKEELWISKASAEQRKGRAGRTSPGHCVRLYDENILHNQMNDYDSPKVQQDDLSKLLLRHLLDKIELDKFYDFFPEPPPPEQLEKTKNYLEDLKLIGNRQDSKLAHNVANLPIDISWGLSIIYAFHLGCEKQLIKIACLCEKEISLISHSDYLKRNKKNFKSDHEVLLHIYETWEEDEIDDEFDHLIPSFISVRNRVAQLGNVLYGKFGENDRINDSRSRTNETNSELIRQSLCAGFFFRTGVASNSPNLTPCDPRYSSYTFRVNSSSILMDNFEPNQMMLFTSGSKYKNSSQITLNEVAIIEKEWIEKVNSDWLKKVDFDHNFVELKICSFFITLEKDSKDKYHKIFFNKIIVPSISSLFTRTCVSPLTNDSQSIQVSCPNNRKDEVDKYVKSKLSETEFQTLIKTYDETIVRKLDNKALEQIQKIMDKEKRKLGMTSDIKFIFKVEVKGKQQIKYQTCQVFLSSLVSHVENLLGVVTNSSSSSSSSSSLSSSSSSSPFPSAQSQLSQLIANNQRIKVLFDAKISSESILQMNLNISKSALAMLSLAHFSTHHTQLFVYGGFIRDFLIRGESHGQMDLDLGYDQEYGKSPKLKTPTSKQSSDSEWRRISQWAKNNGIHIKSTNPKGNHVMEYVLSYQESTFSVEIVDVSFFRNKHGLPDADVNSLKILPTSNSAEFAHKFPDGSYGGSCERILGKNGTMEEVCGKVTTIVNNILNKRMKKLNQFTFDQVRTQKFLSRGWTII